MLMHSQLRRFPVVDRGGQRTKLADLALEMGEAEYPAVSHIMLRLPDNQMAQLPWNDQQSIDLAGHCIDVEDLTAASPIPSEELEQMLLLKRDILDAMVLDLLNRRATRANDLVLSTDQGNVRLVGADISSWGILRRLTRGRIRGRSDIFDWKYIEFLRGDPQAPLSGAKYYRRIERLPPGEIANLSDALPYLHAAELLQLLPDDVATDTLEAMSSERQLQVFEELNEKVALRLLGQMAPDAAADLLGRLEPEAARSFLEHLSPSTGAKIIELLRYPDGTTGGIMTNDILVLPAHLTVAEARAALRYQLTRPDFILFIYVVDDLTTRHLRGVLTIRALLTAADDAPIDTIMNPYLITILPLDRATTAAQRVVDSDLAALPVVGQHGQILGAVTVDAALAKVNQGGSRRLPRVFS